MHLTPFVRAFHETRFHIAPCNWEAYEVSLINTLRKGGVNIPDSAVDEIEKSRNLALLKLKKLKEVR
jgi:hypothetical protein